jgi:cytidine deaminase
MDLSREDYELIERAKQIADDLHVDDLHEVAAALRTASGDIFGGIHIEARVGFADVCGEVAALCNMVSSGQRELDTIVAIWGDGKGNHWLLAPCGRCRELISDFNRDAKVIVGSLDEPQKVSITELLPMKDYS